MTRQSPSQIRHDSNISQGLQDLDRRCALMPMSEFGLAERFILRHGHHFRFVEAWRRWLYFDGTRWIKTDLSPERFAKSTINRLKHEAIYYKVPNDNDEPSKP